MRDPVPKCVSFPTTILTLIISLLFVIVLPPITTSLKLNFLSQHRYSLLRPKVDTL